MRSKLIPTMAATEISGVDNRELSAAILTAGMLPTLPIPRSRAVGGIGPVIDAEGEAIQRTIGHTATIAARVV